MAYGLQTLTSGGAVLSDVSSRRPLVVDVQTVASPAIGLTNTYTIPTACTPSNSVCVLDNGAYGAVTSSGVASVYGSQTNGSTTMRTYKYAG